jgi:hypothetical protein
MTLFRRDLNELRYNSLWLLSRVDPSYYQDLFKNAKAFFYGMDREDLVDEMNKQIKERIEDIMGSSIELVLYVHKNLPFLNAFTRSKNPLYADINIYKYTITDWLNDIQNWVFQQAIELEGQIRFQTPARQFI